MKAEQWSDDEVRITDSYLYRESIREIPGRRYEPESKAWFVPLTVQNVEFLKLLGTELDDGLKAMVKPSGKSEDCAAEPPIVRMPIRAAPYRHQITAFNFAIGLFDKNHRGVALLADMALAL